MSTPRFPERSLLIILAGIQFTHILDFMIMMPLGPALTSAFGISDPQFGLLVSSYTFSAGVSGLLATTYIDRFDRRKLLLTLYALFATATLACGLAPGYETLMTARTAAGFFGGILSALVQTIVADTIPYERRGKAMGIVMSAFSVSTVVGVPLGLLIAAYTDWHAPFLGIAAVSYLLLAGAAILLPSMRGHLQNKRPAILGNLKQVLVVRNHWVAFGFFMCLVFAGFSIIPYITIYLQTNAGILPRDIPIIYLLGGAATLFSAPLIGRLADRYGKLQVLRVLVLAACMPMVAITLSGGLPFWALLIVTTSFFVLVSGRVIPGMALVSAASLPQYRGTFMTLNSSLQSMSMGLAALVGGTLIGRDAEGMLQGYWVSGLIAVCANLLALLLAHRLKQVTHS